MAAGRRGNVTARRRGGCVYRAVGERGEWSAGDVTTGRWGSVMEGRGGGYATPEGPVLGTGLSVVGRSFASEPRIRYICVVIS